MKMVFIILSFVVIASAVTAQDPIKYNLTLPWKYSQLDENRALSGFDKRDSSITWLWENNEWILNGKNIYQYDQNLNMISDQRFDWIVDDWMNSSQYLFQYNQNNQKTLSLVQSWNGTEWINNSQVKTSYDNDGNLTQILYQDWAANSWINQHKVDRTYNIDHLVVTSLTSVWDTDKWVNFNYETFNYDANLQTSFSIVQHWDDVNGWVNMFRTTYSYNISGKPDTVLNENWVGNAWINSSRLLYEYDLNNNLILNQNQIQTGGLWYYNYQVSYNYDSFNNLIDGMYQTYSNSMWNNVVHFFYSYDSNQNPVTGVNQSWNGEWINADSTRYYYSPISGVKDFYSDDLIIIYPNPATSFLEIQTEPGQTEEFYCEIYSNTGIKVMDSNKIINQKKIDISKLSPGLYHIVIQTDKGIRVRNFVKL